MDSSSYFPMSNQTSTSISSLSSPSSSSSSTNLNLITESHHIINDIEQTSSSSPFSYDPLDELSLMDQQGLPFYDFLGSSNGGRTSPTLINHYPLDQLELQQKIFPFHPDPNHDDDVDFHQTLASFVTDLGGVESDAGYNSGVDLFTTNIADCSDSTEAYYLKLAIEQNNANQVIANCHITSEFGSCNSSCSNNNFDHSDNDDNLYNISNNVDYDCNSYNNCNSDSNINQKSKRSVLMNLLIDGSDVGAGYTSHNCRALPKRTGESRFMATATTTSTGRYQ